MLALLLAIGAVHAAQPAGVPGRDWGDPAGEECVECHRTENPGLTQEWNHSQHGQAGVNCLRLPRRRKATKTPSYRNSLFPLSSRRRTARVATGRIRRDGRFTSFKAGQILASLDNLLGEVVGGLAAAVNAGCRQCHGGKVEIGKDGRPSLDLAEHRHRAHQPGRLRRFLHRLSRSSPLLQRPRHARQTPAAKCHVSRPSADRGLTTNHTASSTAPT